MSDIFAALRAEFPRDAVSWRAQSMKADGTSAMALAYIDARDVMNRLDEVCGPGGWQCRYPHATAKTVCEIGIRVDGEWIWKADGAGDSDIEAEKGALSDAFKRAAVRWGIGRYLYDLESPWVDCEHYVNHQGKKVWKKWIGDPWAKVKKSQPVPMTGRAAAPVKDRTSNAGAAPSSSGNDDALTKATIFAAKQCASVDDLRLWWGEQIPTLKRNMSPDGFDKLKASIATIAENMSSPFQEAAE